MHTVRGRRCTYEGCGKHSSNGFPGERSSRCATHKLAGMEDVKTKRCNHEGCTTIPSFGIRGEKASRCATHKLEGLVNVTTKRCTHENCDKSVVYGFCGESASMCATHKIDGIKQLERATMRRGWVHQETHIRLPIPIREGISMHDTQDPRDD